MLLKMPGVNSKNAATIMNQVSSIAQLVTLSLDQLTEVLSSSANAKLPYDFLHNQADQQSSGSASAGSTSNTSNAVDKQRRKRLPLKKV